MSELHIEDFTESHFRKLLRLAKMHWEFVSFPTFEAGQRHILWRHDIDLSLERTRALAAIEAEEGVVSTILVNPHSEFYNLLERSQTALVHEILDMGHQLGLHFDAAFHGVVDGAQLDALVSQESELLERLFGVPVHVFSYHNPTAFLLACDSPSYGGRINTYAAAFRDEVGYCSDSNGYWRHRRLEGVLESGSERSIQVLTHPGWWVPEPLWPRARVERAVWGRARATLSDYDRVLEESERANHRGPVDGIGRLKAQDPDLAAALEMLWSGQHFGPVAKLLEAELGPLSEVPPLGVGGELPDATRCSALMSALLGARGL